MVDDDPYDSPRAELLDSPAPEVDAKTLGLVFSGQRLVIRGVLVSVAAAVVADPVGRNWPEAGLVVLAIALVGGLVAIVGVARLGEAFLFPVLVRFVLAIAMIVPVLNLLVMIIFNGKATRVLRAAGYRVGFFGARAPE